MYGRPLGHEGLPFGKTGNDSKPCDGAIKLADIIKFLCFIRNSPKKSIRLFECVPLSGIGKDNDNIQYNLFNNYYSDRKKCGVIDKETNLGMICKSEIL